MKALAQEEILRLEQEKEALEQEINTASDPQGSPGREKRTA